MRAVLVVALAALTLPGTAEALARFSVRVEGQVQLNWQDRATYGGSCATTIETDGNQVIAFHSARAAVVSLKVEHGRVRFPPSVAVPGLVGTISGAGSQTTQMCTGITHADLACDAGPLSAGSVHLAPAGPGRLRLTSLRGNGLPSRMPCVPDTLRPMEYPPLATALARVDTRKLVRRKTAVVAGSDQGVVCLAAEGETGYLARQIHWKLTFRRLHR